MTKWWSVLPIIFLFAFLKVQQGDIVKTVQYSFYDYLQQSQERISVDDIVLINIDEKAIELEGQYPWPRQTVAKYINKTPPSSLIVSTMIWSEEDRFKGDSALAESMSRKAVVLPSAPTHQTTSDDLGIYANVSTFGKKIDTLPEYVGVITPLQELAQMSMGVGAVSAVVDQPTGVLRRVPMMVSINGQPYPSLGLDAVRVMMGEPSYTVKYNSLGVEWIRLGKQDPLVTQPSSELPVAFWNDFVSQSIVEPLPEGKILIFGVTAEGYANPVATPTGAVYPHEVQGHQIQTLISGVQIKIPDWTVAVETLILLIICLGILLSVYTLSTVPAGIVSLGILCVPLSSSFYFWYDSFLFVDAIWSSISGFLVFAQSSFNKYYITYKQKEQIKKQFGTYLSPAMVVKLQENPDLLKLGGDTRHMTFLFCDIRGFTPISEQYKTNPQGLTELVNRFLSPMTEIIMENQGTIDKYMGDCIMAFWNAPLDVDQQERLAVLTSEQMYDRLDILNAELKEEGLLPINIGVGINSGSVVVGNMGSDQRFDYSVLGDAVNLAARLEGQTKEYGVKTILGYETAKELEDEFALLELDTIAVKGKTEPVKIYTVLGTHEWWNDNSAYANETAQHEKMMGLYYNQQFDQAIRFCEDLKPCFLGTMTDFYTKWIDRCNEMKEAGLSKDWDGVYRATTK